MQMINRKYDILIFLFAITLIVLSITNLIIHTAKQNQMNKDTYKYCDYQKLCIDNETINLGNGILCDCLTKSPITVPNDFYIPLN